MAEVGAEFVSPAECRLCFTRVQNVMGEIQGRKMPRRIVNMKSPLVQEDPKQIVRGWESIWGSITTTFLYFRYCPLAQNGQGDILVQDK